MNRELNYLKYYLFFLPLSFIFGPAIFEASTFLGLIIFLIYLNKKYFEINFNLIKIFITINLILIFLSLLSVDIFQSLKSTLFLFRYIVLSLLIAFIVNKFKLSDFKIIFYLTSFITFLIFLDSLIQLKFGFNIIKLSLMESSRVSSFFGDELILGNFIFNLFVFSYFFFFHIENKEKYIPLLILFTFISFIIIFFSGERTSLFKFCIFIFFIYFFYIKKKTLFFIALDIAIIFSVAFILINHIFFSDFIDRLINKTFIDFLSGTEINFFSSIHHNYLLSSVEIFKKNLLFGTGPNTFDLSCKETFINYDLSCSTHPHNLYLQALSETGLIGFLILSTLSLYVFYNLIYFFKKKIEDKFFLSLYFFLVLLPIPSSNLFSNKFLFFISIFFGLFISKSPKIKKRRVREKILKKNNKSYFFAISLIIFFLADVANYKHNQLYPDKLIYINEEIKKKIKHGTNNYICVEFHDFDFFENKDQICQTATSQNFKIKKIQDKIDILESSKNDWGYFRINFFTASFLNKNCKYGITVSEIQNNKNKLRIRIGYNLDWQSDNYLQENKIYFLKKPFEFEQVSFDFYYSNPGKGQTTLSFPELICYRSLL